MAKKSLELMRAERELCTAAAYFTDVLYQDGCPQAEYNRAEEQLYEKARAYARLAELVK